MFHEGLDNLFQIVKRIVKAVQQFCVLDSAAVFTQHPDDLLALFIKLTLRELAALADARGRFEWEQTASLMALIVNLMRDPKKNKPVKAEDFNPYTVKEKAFLKAPLSVLRDVFVKK